jgi:hypothetical protein
MYRPKAKVRISGDDIADEAQDVDVSLLFEQTHVDPARLSAIVRSALRGRAQADLAQVIAEHPIEEGLAELVTYLSLTDPAFRVVFDDDARAQASWQSSDGGVRVADIPRATFARTDAGEG